MSSLPHDTVGLHFALSFVKNWWLVFALAPFFIAPVLTLLGIRERNRRHLTRALSDHGAASENPSREGSKRRRSFIRKLFIDDRSYRTHHRSQVPQIFASSFAAASLASIVLFLAIAAVMVIRAMVVVNKGSISLE